MRNFTIFEANKITMKKYAYLLLFALLLNGCDDGDLTVESFTFDDPDIKIQNCTNTYEVLYKLKSQESLLLQMQAGILKNEATVEGAPQIFEIDNKSSFRLVYRTYDGTVATANICDAIRPSLPNVTNEWFAESGKLVITTKPITSEPGVDKATRITGYSHIIELQNVKYSKPGIQIDPGFIFGVFTTPLKDTETLKLDFDESAEQCTDSKQVFNTNVNATESLTIDNLNSDLIANKPTAPGQPIIQDIGSTTNKVTFRVYSNGFIADDYFCQKTIPTNPTIRETWVAESGQIQVETSTLAANQFKHIITFKDVKLVKGNVSFILGNNFKSWELITP